MNNEPEIKNLKTLVEQLRSDNNILNLKVAEQAEKIQSLKRQIVQLLSDGNADIAKRIERITNDILTFDPNYFEHCSFSNSFNEANKKV